MTRSARGRAVLRFTVESSGKVTDVVLHHTDFTLEFLNKCLARTPERLKFPSFEGEPVVVTLTIYMGVY